MTVTCRNFSAQVLPSGEIRLDIEAAKPVIVAAATVRPGEDRLLSRKDVAVILGTTTRTLTNLQRRPNHPLVFSKSTGKPRIWASALADWLANDPRGAAARAAQLFGPKVESTQAEETNTPHLALAA